MTVGNFADLISTYHSLKETSGFHKNEELEDYFKKIVTELNSFLSEEGYKRFKVDYSYGKGQWATIPWIAILNEDITQSVSEGVYIVFLFSADLEVVYLTLNQGTGGIDHAGTDDTHSEVSLQYKGKLGSDSGFKYGNLSRGSLDGKKRNRPKAYEDACIYWAKYELKNLNKEVEKKLRTDLQTLARLYFGSEELILPQMEAFALQKFTLDIEDSGLMFRESFIARFVASLLSKPFLILTGLSGSGKTLLALSFAKWIAQSDDQICLVPVGADWTNREPLIGYPNALEDKKYVKPESGVLELIEAAERAPELPFFLVLDEMNLSHVERYFADFLSVMESNEPLKLHSGQEHWSGVPATVHLPSNLFVIGTVNIDETTYMFSPKVLDRANTIEFRVEKNQMDDFLSGKGQANPNELTGKGAHMAVSFIKMSKDKTVEIQALPEIKEALLQFFVELKKVGAEFGFRTSNEMLRLIQQLKKLDDALELKTRVDIAINQKLLPKLHGSRRKLCPALIRIARLCLTEELAVEKDVFGAEEFDFTSPLVKYPLTLEKVARMYRGAIENGFTSFAEA